MHFADEISFEPAGYEGEEDRGGKFLTAEFSASRQRSAAERQRATPLARRVMLHLRACYVSKAAILTTPAFHVPVENRSPA
jgi:hypothetical protein